MLLERYQMQRAGIRTPASRRRPFFEAPFEYRRVSH